MKSFKDNAGHDWHLSLNIGTAMLVKDRLGVDPLQPEAGDPPLLTRLGTDMNTDTTRSSSTMITSRSCGMCSKRYSGRRQKFFCLPTEFINASGYSHCAVYSKRLENVHFDEEGLLDSCTLSSTGSPQPLRPYVLFCDEK